MLLEQGHFEICLLDVVMPDLSGVETVRILRARGVQIPIYAFTGLNSEKERAELKAVGFTGFVGKPPKLSELASLVRRHPLR